MFRRLLIVAFFGVIYSPIVLGIPRYDFFGLLTATFYSWCWIVHIVVRDYACIYYSETVALKVPEYLTWLLLAVLLLYYLVKFSIMVQARKEKVFITVFSF